MYYPLGASRAVFTVKDRPLLLLLRRLYTYLASHPNIFEIPTDVVGRSYSTSSLRQYARTLFSINDLSPNLSIQNLLSLLDKTLEELRQNTEKPPPGKMPEGEHRQVLMVSDEELQAMLDRINHVLGLPKFLRTVPARPQERTVMPPVTRERRPTQESPSQEPTAPIIHSDHPPGFFFLATLPLRTFSPAQWLLSGQILRGGVGLFLDAPWASRWRMHALGALLSYSIDPRQLEKTGRYDPNQLSAIEHTLALYRQYVGEASTRTLKGKFFRWFWDPLIRGGHETHILDQQTLLANLTSLVSKGATETRVLNALRRSIALRLGRVSADGVWEPYYTAGHDTLTFKRQGVAREAAGLSPGVRKTLDTFSLGAWSWVRGSYTSLLIWARLHGKAALLGGGAGGLAGGLVGIRTGVALGSGAGSILGGPGSLVGGLLGGVIGGVGGSFLGIPLGSTVGWSISQVFSGFRVFGHAGVSQAMGSAASSALGAASSGAGSIGRGAVGIGRSLLVGSGFRAVSGLLAILFTVKGAVLVALVFVFGATIYFTTILPESGFVPDQVGGGDIALVGTNLGSVGDTGNCTLSREAITTTLPDSVIDTYISQRGVDREQALKIAQLAKASGVNAAVLFGIWKKESTFSKNPSMRAGAEFGCGFPDVGRPSCRQPNNFDESLQCVLNLNTGGVCNLANALAKTSDFRSWMTSYTPSFYKPEGRPGYIDFFGAYDAIVALVPDDSVKSKLTKDCTGGEFIAARYTGFPITPTPLSALTQCFLGGVPLCSHNSDSYGNARRGWNGLDISAPKGTPVYTLTSGQIKEVWVGAMQTSNGGTVADYDNLWVHFQGEDGRTFWYGHNQYILGTKNSAGLVGRRLDVGQQIATVGRYQTDANTHLHFEVSKDGRFINPCDILDCKQYRAAYGSCGKGCQ